MQSILKKILGVVFIAASGLYLPTLVRSQEVVSNRAAARAAREGPPEKKNPAGSSIAETPATPNTKGEPDSTERLNALEEALREQGAQIERLQKLVQEQQQRIQLLAGEPVPPRAAAGLSENTSASSAATVQGTKATTESQTPALEARMKRVEDQVLKAGPFRFSGDFRLRADGIFRAASKAPDPPLTHTQNVRARYRLRLNFDTDLYPALSFHGQLATGPINNALTLDQDFSATTVRHPFFLSEAWIDYHPRKSVQLQGGRVQEVFADNSRFLFDDDIRFNGFNEKYIRALKKNPLNLSSIEFRAGQYILTNPNVAVITPGSPLAHADQIVGTTGRSANLFHQGVLFNQQFNQKWAAQFGADAQLYRNPNQIALASTTEGLVLLIQPGIGLALSAPLTGTGTATTTSGGAIYSARSFEIARLTYRLNYSGFEHAGHLFPVSLSFQFARNVGTGLKERDALLAGVQVGKITKRGDAAFLYVYSMKGANSLISQVTDDDLGTGTGVNLRTNHFRFEYGLAKKVTFQSLFFIQSQLRNSLDFPSFFVPLGAFAPRTFRVQQQIVFSF